MSTPLFCELAYCRNMQASVGPGSSLLGVPPPSDQVAANRRVEPLSLTACPRKVGCGEPHFETQYLAYGSKETGEELFPVFDGDLPKVSKGVETVLQKRRDNFGRCGFLGALREFYHSLERVILRCVYTPLAFRKEARDFVIDGTLFFSTSQQLENFSR